MDILKDLLEYRIRNQTTYNEHMINVRNPEVRQIFTNQR